MGLLTALAGMAAGTAGAAAASKTKNNSSNRTSSSSSSSRTSSSSSGNRTSSGSSSNRTGSSSGMNGAQLGASIGSAFGPLGAMLGGTAGALTSGAAASAVKRNSGTGQQIVEQPQVQQQPDYQSQLDAMRQQLQNEYKQQTQAALDAYKSESQKQMDAYRQQAEAAQKQLAEREAALRAEQEAKVKANVASLNATKPQVQQAGAAANRQAQQNYYSLINPNGAGAEARAALGLSGSGLTESAQIAAGNAYTGAVNSNQQNVDNQLAQIDLAITQAQLNGDLATAQQLQSYYETVYNGGMQSANNLAQMGQQYAGTLANLGLSSAGQGASLGQWGIENMQGQSQRDFDNTLSAMQFMEQQKQNNINNLLAQAGLTGYLNGQQTMQGQQAALDRYQSALDQEASAYNNIALKRENAMKLFEYNLMQNYGMQEREAALEAARLANQLTEAEIRGTDADTLYKQMQAAYAKKKNGL